VASAERELWGQGESPSGVQKAANLPLQVNRSVATLPFPTSSIPQLNSADLHQSQKQPLAKVGWTCQPILPRGDTPAYDRNIDVL